jgi:3-oxoacyl-[acyl-carrier-protein] synthase-1
MQQAVYIAGKGAISCIGKNVQENSSALHEERTGIGPIRYLSTLHATTFPAGEVKADNDELAAIAGWTGTNSRTSLLGFIAAREALQEAGLWEGNCIRQTINGRRLRIGLISSTTVAGMDLTENFFPGFLDNPRSGKLRYVKQHEAGATTERIALGLGVKDYLNTISTACSSSANAIMLGARLLKAGQLDVVIAGGTDALSKFTLNGFNTLMILDQQLCQPFDKQRRGLNLGEGAGFVVLIGDKTAELLGGAYKVKLAGYANANDAHHQTASSPDGTGSFLAMKGALEMAGVVPEEVGYINLHGTGTQNNDSSESIAIQRLFGNRYPPMSTTKSFTGHTLAACGGLEAIYSCVSLEEQVLFPSLRIEQPVIEEPGIVITSLRKVTGLRSILSNSFGFGGNCSSLFFSLT